MERTNHAETWKNGRDCKARVLLKNCKGREEGKTQEKMERGGIKRSSSAGREKMERVGGR